MEHLGVLLNIVCLMAGAGALAALVRAWRAGGGAAAAANLAFFASYTYLMVAAALFAYWFVNIDSGDAAQRAFEGSMFVGVGLLILTLPRVIAAQCGLPPSPRRARLALAGGLLALAQAPLAWFAVPAAWRALPLALAFLPFGAVLAWSVAAIVRSRPFRAAAAPARPGPWFFLLYLPVGALAAWEFGAFGPAGQAANFISLSLPLAYALNTVQFLLGVRPAPPAAATGAPSADPLARLGLSPRETEIARAILDGRANKEIAADLGLSENTVRNHIYRLYQKLGIQKRMDLVRLVQAPSGTENPPPPEA